MTETQRLSGQCSSGGPGVLAYFISSHGFGHAARSSAVIEALLHLAPELHIVIFAGTPRWFFEQSLGTLLEERCLFLPWKTDVGLVQATALDEDLESTVESLEGFLPPPPTLIRAAAEAMREVEAELLVADISPLGLAAAQHLGIPAVLVENFTWDWIYRGYGHPRLEEFADRVEPLFGRADLRLKASPACSSELGTSQEVVLVPPIARRPRLGRQAVRSSLGVPDDAALVMVTMGGVPWNFEDLERQLAGRFDTHRAGAGARSRESARADRWLLVAGGSKEDLERHGRVLLLPHRSRFYHPDLVAASDAVVAKLGYSTVAEVAQSGLRLGYIPRPRFPESPPMEAWVRQHLAHHRLEGDELVSGAWLDHLDTLLAQPAKEPMENGADAAARAILGVGSKEH